MPRHLAWAILTTLFCCLPLGIVSIVHAGHVGRREAAGDIPGAWDASQKAKTWAVVAATCGVVIYGVLFVGWLLQGPGGVAMGAMDAMGASR